MLVKVGEVLEFGKYIFSSRKCFRLTPLPLLSFLPTCTHSEIKGQDELKEAGGVIFSPQNTPIVKYTQAVGLSSCF